MSRVRTGGRAEALAHAAKAREFLDAAGPALEAGWRNAATGSAVTAGINAKDALCLVMVGRSTASDDDRAAVSELRALGSPGRDPAAALEGSSDSRTARNTTVEASPRATGGRPSGAPRHLSKRPRPPSASNRDRRSGRAQHLGAYRERLLDVGVLDPVVGHEADASRQGAATEQAAAAALGQEGGG